MASPAKEVLAFDCCEAFMVVPHYPMLTALGLPRRNQYGPV